VGGRGGGWGGRSENSLLMLESLSYSVSFFDDTALNSVPRVEEGYAELEREPRAACLRRLRSRHFSGMLRCQVDLAFLSSSLFTR
jgi:hypothetical protein